MRCQPFIERPGAATDLADPEASRVYASVDNVPLVGATRLDGPDVCELFAAAFGELDAALGLLPCLAEVVAVAQECAEEVAIVGGVEALLSVTLVECGGKDSVARERG